MNPMKVLYVTLNIRTKIEEDSLRLLYLKDGWGLPQSIIAELEDISQAKVSRDIIAARKKHGAINVKDVAAVEFTAEEIQQLMDYPISTFTDMQIVAFVQHILELKVNHMMFNFMTVNGSVRAAALCSLGVQQKHVAAMLKILPSTVSYIMKRKGKSGFADGHAENSPRRRDKQNLTIEKQTYSVFKTPSKKFFIASN